MEKFLTWASDRKGAQFSIDYIRQFQPERQFKVVPRPCYEHLAPKGCRIKQKIQVGLVYDVIEIIDGPARPG